MPATLTIPRTLPRTLDEVRSRLRAELGTVGIPNLHWPLATGEDCLGFLTWAAGIRDRDDLTTSLIRISAFRASAGWQEIRDAHLIRPGDWVLWDWDEVDDPDHAEFVYSVDRVHDEITTISANTGPRPGVDITRHPELRGVYQKTRPLSSPELWGALRASYRQPTVTSAEIRSVRAAGTYLNGTMPATLRDEVTGRLVVLHRTEAGDLGKQRGDGKRGPLYRLLVQAWGATHDSHGKKVDRAHALYGPTYRLDGIFGRRSDYVEEVLWDLVRRAR